MIRIYRQNELRAKYPSSTLVIESDEWTVELKNPFSRDWWRTWTGPQWGTFGQGVRWRAFLYGLKVVRFR